MIKHKYINLYPNNHISNWIIWKNTAKATNYCLQVFPYSFLPSQREWASSQNQQLLSEVWEEALGEEACNGVFTQTLNSTANMFSSLVISKAFSRIPAPVIGMPSFHLSVTHSPVKLFKSRLLWHARKIWDFHLRLLWFIWHIFTTVVKSGQLLDDFKLLITSILNCLINVNYFWDILRTLIVT